MIWINFGKWSMAGSFFLKSYRIFREGHKWTPFIRVYKRFDSWLGYWKGGEQFYPEDK
jgi:hypothetical protein